MLVDEVKPDALGERAAAREQLADAINAVDDARTRLDEAKAAVEAGWDRMITAGNRLDALKAKLPQLSSAPAAAEVISALAAGSNTETRSPRAVAESEIAALEGSREQLRRAIETGEREVETRKRAVENAKLRAHRAAVGVLRSSGATERLLRGLLDLERQVVERRLGLAFLLRNDGVPVALLGEVGKLLDGHSLPSRAAAIDHWGRHPTTAAWAGALKALATDPDARLPG